VLGMDRLSALDRAAANRIQAFRVWMQIPWRSMSCSDPAEAAPRAGRRTVVMIAA
jgi:hypothetical protein